MASIEAVALPSADMLWWNDRDIFEFAVFFASKATDMESNTATATKKKTDQK